ncbi:MAG: hypothetical protein NC182_04990 [Prevotella sp.]|nr:hypothetical protein [Staphylococcus sp.]MCM1350539.1 hypothetical protein [Prevotella sp.]
MNQFEKQIRSKVKSEMKENSEPRKELYDQVSKRVGVIQNEKTKKSYKRWIQVLAPCVCLMIVATIVIAIVAGQKPVAAHPTIVQVDVNPSIEMVVDENNQVLSIRGCNDEGKMIIEGEAIVGKTLDEAVETIIRLETQMGYLLVNTTENEVTITISAENNRLTQQMQEKTKSYISKACEKLNVKAQINEAKGYVIGELQTLAKTLDPTLTEEEIQNLTYDQLIHVVELYHLEVASFASVKLEEMYQQVKAQEIKLAEKEATKRVVDQLESIYQTSITAYDTVYQTFIQTYQSLQESYYENFVSDASHYQNALDHLAMKKAELLKQRAYVASLPEDTDALTRMKETAQLTYLEAEYASLEVALTSAEQLANQTYQAICYTFEEILKQMEALESKLPTSIKDMTFQAIMDTEEKLNAYKKQVFESFENAHLEDIEKAKQALQTRKQALIDYLHS